MLGFLKKKLGKLREKIVGSSQAEEPKESEKAKESKAVEKELKKAEEKKVEGKKVEKEKEEKKKKPVEKEKKTKEGLLKKIKQKASRRVRLSEGELEDYLWDLELILLESDVAHETAEKVIADLREKLAGTEFSSRRGLFNKIVRELRNFLGDMIPKTFDILASKKSPTVIMFIGPNGSGKTTTIAKLAKSVIDSNRQVIFAASDTFRAASIEQLEEHAKKLGVKVIKHNYGADPAAVAYDAVESARAREINFVFIDTAGRQETNKNLIEELKKIKRVVKPDYTIYVDEGIAGNVLLDRLKNFGEVGIDGVILTKMDLDVKGGGVITAASLGIPILYIGTGQGYGDIKPFNKSKFLDDLLGPESGD